VNACLCDLSVYAFILYISFSRLLIAEQKNGFSFTTSGAIQREFGDCWQKSANGSSRN